MTSSPDFLARMLGDADPRPDPMRAAQKNMRPQLRKRFYREVGIAREAQLFVLTLDGRKARTPGKNALAVSRHDLAEALAAEWNAQQTYLDPATMQLTRLVHSALDHVAHHRAEVVADLARYAGSDLLFYRASEPEKLVVRQSALWDPVLAWSEAKFGARFHLSEGIGFVEQPATSIGALRAAVEQETDPLRLSALHVVTTLTGSILLALALASRHLTADQCWLAAHVDEDVQMEIWGRDAEALERRAYRRREFDAAAQALGV